MNNKTRFLVGVAICFAASLVISTFQYFETTDFLIVCILYFVLEKKIWPEDTECTGGSHDAEKT